MSLQGVTSAQQSLSQTNDDVQCTNKHLKRTLDMMERNDINYDEYITQNIKTALSNLQRNPENPNPKATLFSLLTSDGKAFHLPATALPKQLRRRHIVSNTKVMAGELGGFVLRKELGRGAFGRVILMNTHNSWHHSNIAVKVQSPTGSLAWEYTVLRRLKSRLLQDERKDVDYPYPEPISFISLADGGLVSMSAASETGLNLVDLSNFYKLKLGKSVPELIALHYTSIGMRIIEQLHWHGKILVSSFN